MAAFRPPIRLDASTTEVNMSDIPAALQAYLAIQMRKVAGYMFGYLS